MSRPAKRAKKILLAAKRSLIRGKVSRRFEAELRCFYLHEERIAPRNQPRMDVQLRHETSRARLCIGRESGPRGS